MRPFRFAWLSFSKTSIFVRPPAKMTAGFIFLGGPKPDLCFLWRGAKILFACREKNLMLTGNEQNINDTQAGKD